MEASALTRPRPTAASAGPWAAAAAAAVLAGLLLVYSPARAFAAAGLPLFAYGVIWHPKATAGLGALLILFSQPVGELAPTTKLVDEAFVAAFFSGVMLTRLATGQPFRGFPGLRWLLLYLAAGLASAAANTVPLALAGADAFLFCKGFLFAIAVAQLDWQPGDVRLLIRDGGVAFGGVCLATILNVLYPDFWFSNFGLDGAPQVRLGIDSLIGPFNHPGSFGHVMALFAIAITAHRVVYGPSSWWLPALITAVIGTLLSLRRKAFLALLVALAPVIYSVRQIRVRASVALVVVGILGAVVLWDAIESVTSATGREYFGQDQPVARVALYDTSYAIAKSDFPLGVGLGRFGGHVAYTHYSPVYRERGLYRVYGLAPGGGFATDTFWPAILGETGVLGLLAYALALVAMLGLARRLAKERQPALRFVGLVLIGWWAEFLIESIASPVYSSPPSYPLFFGLAGVGAALAVRSRGEQARGAPG